MNNNKKKVVVILCVVVLLGGAYYAGSQSHKSKEVIIPSVQSSDVTGAVSASTVQSNQKSVSGGIYDYTEAVNHVGENATIRGTVIDVYTSKTGTIFFDFCKSYKTCPFSAVIFASSAGDFQNIKQYTGQNISITGTVTSYQGKAEIVIESPSQIGN
jgi:DNA/RNA endonuclease YhcR with UshA esterase domain